MSKATAIFSFIIGAAAGAAFVDADERARTRIDDGDVGARRIRGNRWGTVWERVRRGIARWGRRVRGVGVFVRAAVEQDVARGEARAE